MRRRESDISRSAKLLFGLTPLAIVVAAASLSLYAQGEAIKGTGGWPRLDLQLLAAFGTGLLVSTLYRGHFMTIPLVFFSVQMSLSAAAPLITNVGATVSLGYLIFWLGLLSLAPCLIGSLIALPLAAGVDLFLRRKARGRTFEDEFE